MPRAHLFAALDVEWQRVASSGLARRRLAEWGDAHRVLHGFNDLDSLVAFVRRPHTPAASDGVLAVLVRLAKDDDLAARTALQSLIPGIRAIAIASPWAGDPDEVDAMVVAAAWELIRSYPSDRRPERVAANIVFDVRKRLCRSRRRRLAEERAETRKAVSEEMPECSYAEQVLSLLNSAVSSGDLTPQQASLVAATRVGGIRLRELAPSSGHTVRWLRERRNRAEATLRQVAP